MDGDEKITNYTIFWCENDKDRPYQCTVSVLCVFTGNSILH